MRKVEHHRTFVFLNRRDLNSLEIVKSDEISISYKYFWIIFYCRSSSETFDLSLSHSSILACPLEFVLNFGHDLTKGC